MSEKYLVTGGCGFIGSNLVEELIKRGHSVRILDNLSTGKIENLDNIYGGIEFIEGDLRSLEDCKRAVKGIKYVFHLGAYPSVPRSIKEPLLSHDINIGGTLNILMASKDEGVERFIFSSSSSVYGDTEKLPKTEDMLPNPLSPYASQKLAGEFYCKIFYSIYGLKTIILRYFNVFGPRQDPNSQYSAVIPIFIKSAFERRPPVIYGGRQTRDFTFVDNVVLANIKSCSEFENYVYGNVYNIACGNRISIEHLVEKINEVIGVNIMQLYAPKRKGDVMDSQADISKAAKYLLWFPSVEFDDGIKKTIQYYEKLYN